MAGTKKVYFYKLFTTDTINPKSAPQPITELVKTINGYNTDNESFTYPLNDEDNTIIDILSVMDNAFFGRIGKKEDLNYLHMRSSQNYSSQNIQIPSNYYAEKFTYFYFNSDTNILAYMNIQGAPLFRKFERFAALLYNNKSYDVSLIAISNDNVLDLLRKKDIFYGASFKTTVPIDQFLGCENLGIDRNTFIELENAENITIAVGLTSKRMKNIINSKGSKDNNKFLNTISEIMKKKNITGKVKAKTIDEKSQTYDLIGTYFTYQVDLPKEKNDTNFSNAIKKNLITAYNNSLEGLLQYTKQAGE